MLSFLSIIFVITLYIYLFSIGLGYQILQELAKRGIQLGITLSLGLAGLGIGIKLNSRVTKADEEEVKREDDVLLEAVGFSHSVSLLIVNLFLIEQSAILSILIITSGVGFYSLRGWAKIKNSQIFRYFSMFFLSIAISNILTIPFIFSFLSFNIMDYFFFIYLGIFFAFSGIIGFVFRKRYGLNARTHEIKKLQTKYINRKKKKEKQEKKDNKENEIVELISLVEDKFKNAKYTPLTLASILVSMSIVIMVYSVLFYIFYQIAMSVLPVFGEMPIEGQAAILLAEIAIIIALIQLPSKMALPLLKKMTVKELTDWNYKRMENEVNDRQRPLLKALIQMKCKHPDFDLSELFADKRTNGLFDEQKLLKSLYE